MESVKKVNENCIDFGFQKCNFFEKWRWPLNALGTNAITDC